jgi:hypothetical protein
MLTGKDRNWHGITLPTLSFARVSVCVCVCVRAVIAGAQLAEGHKQLAQL